jgi:hypothetical protein
MSENALEVRAEASLVESASLRRTHGPSAWRTALLIARITFLEAARRRILWREEGQPELRDIFIALKTRIQTCHDDLDVCYRVCRIKSRRSGCPLSFLSLSFPPGRDDERPTST